MNLLPLLINDFVILTSQQIDSVPIKTHLTVTIS